MTAILKITNGTDTVDLLAGQDEYGLHLAEWEPATAGYKGGGAFRDSPLAHGRRIVGKYFENVIETMTIAVKGNSADDMAFRLSQLRQLLEQASDYWIAPYPTTPVWLIAKASKETNTRYALVQQGRVATDKNYYATPFLQPGCDAAMPDLQLTIERGHWQSSEPGERECANPLKPVSKTFTVLESGDDAFVIDALSFIQTTATYLATGSAGPAQSYQTGIRFKNVTIPQSAKILSAHILFESLGGSSTTINLRIYGELSASPAIFSSYANFAARPLTSAFQNWSDVPAAGANTDFSTPDFPQVIQEIVNLPAWRSGNNLVVFIRDNSTTFGSSRLFAAYENSTLHPPALVVTWLDEGQSCDDADYPIQLIVTSKQNRSPLSGLYYYDASLTTFSANLLLNTVFPYNLLPVAVATGDILYYLVDSLIPEAWAFDNIVHDLADSNVDLTITWEVWTGAAWTGSTPGDIDLVDHTDDLSASGICSVHTGVIDNGGPDAFDMSTLGGTNNPGVTGYVLRARVTAAGSTNPPRVQNSHPYTVTWPFIEFPATSMPGDLPPLGSLELRYRQAFAQASYFVFGLRSVARGENFNAFLNASDRQHPPGLACAVNTSTSFGNEQTTATGRSATCNFATATAATRVTWTLTPALSQEYIGRYRVFLRLAGIGVSTPDMDARLVVDLGSNALTLDWVALTDDDLSYDLGVLDFNNTGIGTLAIDSLTIKLQMRRNSGVQSVSINDLVLIPVDEYAAEGKEVDGDTVAYLGTDDYLDFDSITNPKSGVHTLIRKLSNGNVYGSWRTLATPQVFQVNKRQRLYFFSQRAELDGDTISFPWDALAVAPYKLSRYFGLRGSN